FPAPVVARGWWHLHSLWAGGPCFPNLSLEAAPSGNGSPWRLLGALCLQRPRLMTKPLTRLQKETVELLQKVETERSLYSDHELRALDGAK
uniref:Large ribosomal subunit protein mL46 N-terminal domain-containing protein n=1 Tax=Peromyscus maniculatus bairdii TaxID=230844 RepID=A0A8C8W688_PERMB